MNIRLKPCLILMLGFLLMPVARAEPTITEQVEVNFLLGYVDGSVCEFNRNGAWHDSKKAQEHLRDKFKYMSARNLIITTEDFIEKVATKSSFTGRSYQVRCGDGVIMSSNQWLRAELARFRKF